MFIDQYIEEMQKLRQAHGPALRIIKTHDTGTAVNAGLPRLHWLRTDKPKTLFVNGQDRDAVKGEKVVRL